MTEQTEKVFAALKRYDPAGREAWYTIPIEGLPRLKTRYAGTSNREYINEAGKATARTAAKRIAAQDVSDIDTIAQLGLDIDRESFPGTVVVDWEGWERVPGMNAVAFSVPACRELFEQLPEHLMRALTNWVCMPNNFPAPESENGSPPPSYEQVKAQAGN